MIEVIVIVALVLLLGWEKYQNRKERAKYLNAIISKDATEMANLDLADKTKTKVKVNPPKSLPPDLIPESQASDEEFMKQILQE